MPSVAVGAKEIRIRKPHEHRVIYIAQFPEAIYVLSAFEKKTQQTPQRYIDAARQAYAEIQRRRKNK
jgi:phage-related protein